LRYTDCKRYAIKQRLFICFATAFIATSQVIIIIGVMQLQKAIISQFGQWAYSTAWFIDCG